MTVEDWDTMFAVNLRGAMLTNPVALAPHGGKLGVFADEPRVLEGAPDHKRCIVIEFPDRASAEAWYASATHQAAIPLRQR